MQEQKKETPNIYQLSTAQTVTAVVATRYTCRLQGSLGTPVLRVGGAIFTWYSIRQQYLVERLAARTNTKQSMEFVPTYYECVCSFYPSTPSTTSVRADSSSWRDTTSSVFTKLRHINVCVFSQYLWVMVIQVSLKQIRVITNKKE